MKIHNFNKSLALAAALALSASSLHAQTHSVADGDWDVPGTWNNGVPVNDAYAAVLNGNTVTFTSSDSYSGGGNFGQGLYVGHDGTFGPTASGAGTLNMTGGFLDAGYMSVGHNNTGIINLSGGTLQSGVEAYIGFGATPTATAVNITGGTFNLYGNAGVVGALGQGSTATMNISGSGILDVNRSFFVRNNSSLTVSTGGTVNVSSGNQLAAQSGTVNVNGGTIASSGFMHVGDSNTAAMNITSGTVTNTGTTFLGFAGGAGTVTQSGGTATYQDLFFGNGTGTGTYNLSGGTARVNGTLGFGVFASGGAATINQTGGILELTSTTNTTSTPGSAYNLEGGTLRALGNVAFFNGGGAFPAVNITGASGDVTLDTNGFNVTTVNGSTFDNGAATLTKTGAGTFAIGNGGGLTIANGELLVDAGTLQTDDGIFIASGASVGGDGTIVGDLTLGAGADFVFSLTNTLTVNDGTVSFGGFSIADLIGLSSSIANGTYTLIDGNATFNFTNVSNFGQANAFDLGNGKSAYFQAGSLQLVVVPEPTTWALMGLGLLGLIALRRRQINA